MYQICLVIKEDLRDEVSSMLVSGHESLEDAAEKMLVDFERLQNANEISAKVDKFFEDILTLEEAGMTISNFEEFLKACLVVGV